MIKALAELMAAYQGGVITVFSHGVAAREFLKISLSMLVFIVCPSPCILRRTRHTRARARALSLSLRSERACTHTNTLTYMYSNKLPRV